MNQLPTELISHVLQFLPLSDRKEAALVCRDWHEASLHPLLQKDVIIRCKSLDKESLSCPSSLKRKMTHLEFREGDSRHITEETLTSLLKECYSLELLDLSGCNNLFLSGRLLSRDSDKLKLQQSLANMRVVKLGRLKYMTDITFERLVSCMVNLEQISLAATNMIFGSNLYGANLTSPAMLHFSAFLKFVYIRADKLKSIDLSFTAINDDSLKMLAQTHNLSLDAVNLAGCSEISDKGLRLLVTHQHSLKSLDLTDCKQLGNHTDFFGFMANNLPQLQSLIMKRCKKIGQCDIASLQSFPSLQVLDMGEVPRFVERDLVKGLCFQGSGLTGLFLPFCPDVSDELVVQLCKHANNLMILDLSSCSRVTDVALHAISKSLIKLQTLILNGCREISDLGLLGIVPENGMPSRFTFDFDHEGCPCSRERDSKIFRKPAGAAKNHKTCTLASHFYQNTKKLLPLSNLKSLKVLDLSACSKITDRGITEIIKFPDLQLLSLNGLSKLTDKAITSLAYHNPNLEILKLANLANITDIALAELVIHSTQLNSLDVSQCSALTDRCLKAMAAYCDKLLHLDVSFTGMTIKAVLETQSQLSKAKIVFRPHIE